MQRILLLLVLVQTISTDLISQPGQPTRKRLDISSCYTQFLLVTKRTFAGKEKIPFRKIDILDCRFDTSKVGYHIRNRVDEKITFKGGCEATMTILLNDYFKNNLDGSSSKTLLFVVKKLWLQNEIVNQMLLSKEKDFPIMPYYLNRNPVCIADIDVFAESNLVCKALVRVSNNFKLSDGDQRDNISLLLLPFDSIIRKINVMDVGNILSGKKEFSTTDIRANYESRFNIPILNQKDLSRGIYLTFEDFKNNKVSHPDFKYKIDKLSADVMIPSGEQSVLLIDYWGFYDGKDLFIKPGHKPFKAVRQGNTFDFYGSLRGDTHDNSVYAYDFEVRYTVSIMPLYPLQVDMETGKVY